MKSLAASVHMEERASRLLLIIRLALAPFILAFILANIFVNLILLLPIALLYFITRKRSDALFSLPQFFIQQCGNWLAFFLLLSDTWPPRAATARMAFIAPVSRFELFFRPFFSAMFIFNELVFCFFCSLALFMQFFHMLVFGRKRLGLHKFIALFWLYFLEGGAYILLGTDERPALIPHSLDPKNWHKMLE